MTTLREIENASLHIEDTPEPTRMSKIIELNDQNLKCLEELKSRIFCLTNRVCGEDPDSNEEAKIKMRGVGSVSSLLGELENLTNSTNRVLQDICDEFTRLDKQL